MPIEPPDPLNIAATLREIRTRADAALLDVRALLMTDTANVAVQLAYRDTQAAIMHLTSAADTLDPPVPR